MIPPRLGWAGSVWLAGDGCGENRVFHPVRAVIRNAGIKFPQSVAQRRSHGTKTARLFRRAGPPPIVESIRETEADFPITISLPKPCASRSLLGCLAAAPL